MENGLIHFPSSHVTWLTIQIQDEINSGIQTNPVCEGPGFQIVKFFFLDAR